MRCLGFYKTMLEFKLEEIREEYGIFIAFGLLLVAFFLFDVLKEFIMGL